MENGDVEMTLEKFYAHVIRDTRKNKQGGGSIDQKANGRIFEQAAETSGEDFGLL